MVFDKIESIGDILLRIPLNGGIYLGMHIIGKTQAQGGKSE